VLDDGLVDDKDVLDDDVLTEENSIAFKQTAPIMYHNLWKVYPPSAGWLASLCRFVGRIRCCCCCGKGAKREEKRRAYLPKRAVRGVSTVVEAGETYCSVPMALER
jgi:hypothetical protein